MVRSLTRSIPARRPLFIGQKRRVIPGFGLSLGFTVLYLSLVVLIPLAGLFWKSAGLGFDEFVRVTTSDRAIAAYRLTLFASLVARAFTGKLDAASSARAPTGQTTRTAS